MSAARRSNGLLSAQQTVALLELIQRQPAGGRRHQLLTDFAAFFPAAWAKADSTIEFLCYSGLLNDADNLISVTESHKNDSGPLWFCRLGKHVATVAAAMISEGQHARCLQAGGSRGGLWLDSMLFPATHDGLPLWIIEFETASRERTGSRFWRIATAYEYLFLEAARSVNNLRATRSMTPAQLEARLEQNVTNGLIAEEWVLNFERRRLATHPLVDQVRRISEEDVSAGYDIVSFSGPAALHYDLFIEVKSYTGPKRFFWSRNEIETAESLGEEYSLYLIDRDKFILENYEPQIIRGPHSALFESNTPCWSVSPQGYECIELLRNEDV